MTIAVNLDRSSLLFLIRKKLELQDSQVEEVEQLSDKALSTICEISVNKRENKASVIKIGEYGQKVRFKIPSKIVERLDLEYGDRFNIKIKSLHKEIIFEKADGGMVKLRANNETYLPKKILSTGLAKLNEYAISVIEDNKIIYKMLSNY